MAPRKQEQRSASPAKSPRKTASPRKRAPRATSVAKSDASEASEPAKKASKALQSLTNGASATPSTVADDVVRVEVDETVEKENDLETTHTIVKVEIPAHHPDLALPENTDDMIAKAKEMVEEATKLEEKKKRSRPTKRKAGEAELEDGEPAEGSSSRAKKARMAETLRKERVRSRALIALTASVAIGFVALAHVMELKSNLRTVPSFRTSCSLTPAPSSDALHLRISRPCLQQAPTPFFPFFAYCYPFRCSDTTDPRLFGYPANTAQGEAYSQTGAGSMIRMA